MMYRWRGEMEGQSGVKPDGPFVNGPKMVEGGSVIVIAVSVRIVVIEGKVVDRWWEEGRASSLFGALVSYGRRQNNNNKQ